MPRRTSGDLPVKLRRFLFHVHLYTGLLVGLLLSLTGITGSVLVFSHELDALLYPKLLHARPPGATATPLPPQAILDAVRKNHPEAGVSYLLPPQEAGEVYDVRLKGGRRLFLDPFTGNTLGQRTATDHPIGFLFSLHTELLSGETGEKVVGVGGLLLILLGVTGIVLWWPGKKGVRQGFTVQWRASWKRVNFDLHRVSGIIAVFLLTLIALTGAALVWGAEVTDWTYRLTGTPPRPKVSVSPRSGAEPLSLDLLLTRAEAALPGGVVTRIVPAAKPTAAAVVRKRLPGDLHPNGMSFIHLDPYSGEVLYQENALQATLGPQLLNLRFPLHAGSIGGWPVRVLYALAGLTPAFLFVTGCLMWWNRYWVPRRRRAARRPGA